MNGTVDYRVLIVRNHRPNWEDRMNAALEQLRCLKIRAVLETLFRPQTANYQRRLTARADPEV